MTDSKENMPLDPNALVPGDRYVPLVSSLLERHFSQILNNFVEKVQKNPPFAPTHEQIVRRLGFALGYYTNRFEKILEWLAHSVFSDNFTYDLSERNQKHLAHLLSVITGRHVDEIEGYFSEILEDEDLRKHYLEAMQSRMNLGDMDKSFMVARRLGWYAVVRILKPKVLVETGVNVGHGSLVLTSALLRNRDEGYPGRYFGTEINPDFGFLLHGRYAEVGEILYGDSIESLKAFDQPIDLFINDSDHSADYEAREYEVVLDKLSPDAMILGDNAHATDSLMDFCRKHGWQFVFFKEDPIEHWYPGAGIGIAFQKTP